MKRDPQVISVVISCVLQAGGLCDDRGCFRRRWFIAARTSQGERLYKNGHTVRGAQRAKCKDCQRTFTLAPRGPRHSPALKKQVLSAYQDRMSLRGIHRTFGVCYQIVVKWLGKKAEQLPSFKDTLPPAQEGDVLELDELWSFVGSKAEALWLWVALCRRTRQVVA